MIREDDKALEISGNRKREESWEDHVIGLLDPGDEMRRISKDKRMVEGDDKDESRKLLCRSMKRRIGSGEEELEL
jgi:hypothetical protein